MKLYMFRLFFGIFHFWITTLVIMPGASLFGKNSLEILGQGYSLENDQVYYHQDKIRGADPSSFEVLEAPFAKDKNQVYCEGEVIFNARPDSFRVLLYHYSRDANRVFYRSFPIKNADIESFMIIDICYSKDRDHVYCHDKILLGANNENFDVGADGLAKDGIHFYYYHYVIKKPENFRQIDDFFTIYNNQLFFCGSLVKESHLPSFTILDENYARDKNRVYYHQEDRYFKILKGANPESFEIFQFKKKIGFKEYKVRYAKDDKTVFIDGNTLEKADPDSFRVLDFNFAADKKHVYFQGRLLEDSHPVTFKIGRYSREVGNTDSFVEYNYIYSRDSESVYFRDKKIHGSDAKSFQEISFLGKPLYSEKFLLPGSYLSYDYARDLFKVYYRGAVLKNADPQQLNILSYHYCISRDMVYFKEKPIIEADADSFRVFENHRFDAYYAGDKRYIYFKGDIIQGVDRQTFQVLSSDYARDKHRVYFKTQPLPGYNPATFDASLYERFGKYYSKVNFDDSGELYINTGEQVIFTKHLLKNADPATFEEHNYYATDKNQVYYNGVALFKAQPQNFLELSDHLRYAGDKNRLYFNGILVKGAHPGSFEILDAFCGGKHLTKDRSRIYLGSRMRRNSDSPTFNLSDLNEYAWDKNQVYWEGRIIPGAEPDSFETLEEGYARDKHRVYYQGKALGNSHSSTFKSVTEDVAMDKNQVYWKGIILKNSDPASFNFIEGGQDEYAWDKNQVYYFGDYRYPPTTYADILIDGADPKSFTIIDSNYSKDEQQVFYHSKPLAHSRPNSFRLLEDYYAEDNGQFYYRGFILPKVDGNSFLTLGGGYAKDQQRVFYCGQPLKYAHSTSFSIILPHGGSPKDLFAKDKTYVYYNGQVQIGMHAPSFEILSLYYAKDQYCVYSLSTITNYYQYGIANILERTILSAIPTSFRLLNHEFARDNQHIYWQGKIFKPYDKEGKQYIGDVDINSFKIIDDHYSKDKDHVFLHGRIVKDADPKTFILPGKRKTNTETKIKISDATDKRPAYLWEKYLYGKTHQQIYFNNRLLTSAHVPSFKVLMDYYAKDNNHIYYKGKILSSAHVPSFETYSNSEGYAKDKNRVYFKGREIPGISPATFREWQPHSYCMTDGERIFENGKPILGVHINTFQYINESFSKDRDRVYCSGTVIEGADPATFKVFGDGYHAKDKNRVYRIRSFTSNKRCDIVLFPGADPETFEILTFGYTKDKYHVFYENIILKGANPKAFCVLNSNFVRDDHHVYRKGKRFNADPKSLKILENGYMKDKDQVFHYGWHLYRAHAGSFITLGGGYAKDRKFVYFNRIILKNVNPRKFKVVKLKTLGYLGVDKANVYLKGKIKEDITLKDIGLLKDSSNNGNEKLESLQSVYKVFPETYYKGDSKGNSNGKIVLDMQAISKKMECNEKLDIFMRRDSEEKYHDLDIAQDLSDLKKGEYHFLVFEHCCACFMTFSVEIKERIIDK